MNSAPNTAPPMVASPPTTTAARNENDTTSVNDSGATKPIENTYSAPPTPAYSEPVANASVL